MFRPFLKSRINLVKVGPA